MLSYILTFFAGSFCGSLVIAFFAGAHGGNYND